MFYGFRADDVIIFVVRQSRNLDLVEFVGGAVAANVGAAGTVTVDGLVNDERADVVEHSSNVRFDLSKKLNENNNFYLENLKDTKKNMLNHRHQKKMNKSFSFDDIALANLFYSFYFKIRNRLNLREICENGGISLFCQKS